MAEPTAAGPEELKKAGFPEQEKDMKPSAMLPAAVKCVQKHVKRSDDLLRQFKDAVLSELQSKFQPQACRGMQSFAARFCLSIRNLHMIYLRKNLSLSLSLGPNYFEFP